MTSRKPNRKQDVSIAIPGRRCLDRYRSARDPLADTSG
jgi:hypothetical protein